MRKQLFFDDNKLFGRDNVVRKYGRPELISVYNDGVCSTDYCTGNVFRLDNGKYRMLYYGHSNEFSGKKLFSAISDDGVNFMPEKLYNRKTGSAKLFFNCTHGLCQASLLQTCAHRQVGFLLSNRVCRINQKEHPVWDVLFGTPDTIRTCDLQSRSLSLYPTSLGFMHMHLSEISPLFYRIIDTFSRNSPVFLTY